jgi:hypothetical protein
VRRGLSIRRATERQGPGTQVGMLEVRPQLFRPVSGVRFGECVNDRRRHRWDHWQFPGNWLRAGFSTGHRPSAASRTAEGCDGRCRTVSTATVGRVEPAAQATRRLAVGGKFGFRNNRVRFQCADIMQPCMNYSGRRTTNQSCQDFGGRE